jgi:galactokinase
LNPLSTLRSKFEERFGAVARIYRAPGRVNLIGEHTDYNDGFVMPAAISFFCTVAAAPREDGKLEVYSEQARESVTVELGAVSEPRKSWVDYPLGVARSLQSHGIALRGASLYISSDVPLGAGLSSSAALEVSVGYALLDLEQHPIDGAELARICQEAENEFVGVKCGIMDQFISVHGRPGHTLLLDCRSLGYEVLPIPPNIKLVICNTMVKHELTGNEYNVRRDECEESVRRLRSILGKVDSLRDVTMTQLAEHSNLLTPVLFRRCRHVVTENERVLQMACALKLNDTKSISALMAESHRSLREDFEVSCAELNEMVEIAIRQPGVYGARMTGGGFGGSTVNLVDAAAAERFREEVATQYFSRTGIRPDIYICDAVDGVARE